MRRRIVVVGIITLFALTACGGHTPPRTATPVPNTRIVPQHITIAYVNAVFVKLNHIYGNAVRATVAAKAMTHSALMDLHDIYSPAIYPEEEDLLQIGIRSQPSDVRKPPGDQVTRVQHLISASKSCIFAETVTTFRKVILHAPRPAPSEYVELVRDPRDMNPTPWRISLDRVFEKPTRMANKCTK